MSDSGLSDSFEYLFYGSTANRNIFTLTAGNRQILTFKVDPRAVRIRNEHPFQIQMYVSCASEMLHYAYDATNT